MRFHLTLRSSNSKTGPIPVSTSPEQTCPPSCPLKNKGCYADGGPLRIHWKKVSSGERGVSYQDFLQEIRNLPTGQLWRHNQCGDFISSSANPEQIQAPALGMLMDANKGKRGFTYTHYNVLGTSEEAEYNRNIIQIANSGGFTVNLSADNIYDADKMQALKIAPVTVMLPSDASSKTYTPNGNLVIVCPVANNKLPSCLKCGLCAKQRKAIIGFPAHGAKKNFLNREIKFNRIAAIIRE